MKQTIFTLLILSVITLASCRKDRVELTAKQNDSVQIHNYITANNITGMLKDTVGGDTSGMYYKILSPGSGTPYDYPSEIYFVYTLRSLDGSYIASDTIANHVYAYVGHVASLGFPLPPTTGSLQSAIRNELKYPGASMRLLIPSHLAYGINGHTTGSSQVANTHLNGNASLDMYVHAIGDIAKYDDQTIQTYMRDSSLTGYTKTASGLYYKILVPGTGTDPITINSTVTCTYTGQLLNATIFDAAYNGTLTASLDLASLTPGVAEGLQYAVAGTKISFLVPSLLGYGSGANVGPAYSCLRFTFQVISVVP